MLVGADGAPLLELLRLQTKLIPRVPADDLVKRLPNLLPGLFEVRFITTCLLIIVPQCNRLFV